MSPSHVSYGANFAHVVLAILKSLLGDFDEKKGTFDTVHKGAEGGIEPALFPFQGSATESLQL